jgi:NDP-sugar pyrophosphorylase family protein
VHEEKILGTGGAIKNAENLLNRSGNFLVYNVDVDSGINIQLMFEHHKMSGAIATLAVKNRITRRYLLTNEENILIGRIENGKEIFYCESEGKNLKTAFCGISILNDEIFSCLPENKYFDIIPEFMKLVNRRKLIRVFDIGDTYWNDLGKQVIEK